MTERLPLKFKLYRKSKFVGYEKHEKVFTGLIWIYHSRNECDWIPMPKPGHGYIDHDVKRQLTNLQDMHGKDIAFGDELSEGHGRPLYEVSFDPSIGIIGINYIYEPRTMHYREFQAMELVEEKRLTS